MNKMEEKDLDQVAGGRVRRKGIDQVAPCPICGGEECSFLEVYTGGAYYYRCAGLGIGGYWKYENGIASRISKTAVEKAKGRLL